MTPSTTQSSKIQVFLFSSDIGASFTVPNTLLACNYLALLQLVCSHFCNFVRFIISTKGIILVLFEFPDLALSLGLRAGLDFVL